ncbi:nitroreductase family protein [Candidatus Woesearchaeota archaeon]|nr:nitroreductase family protein [Candidatus Woesearchaeota archaeon]
MDNETIKTIKTRRSTRGFNQKEISKDVVKELLECARYAPSAMNRQPWRFIVISDKELISEMSEHIKQKAIEKFPHVKERAESMKDPIFYGSGLLVMILRPKDDEWAMFDCSAAAENMMLAARSLEIGSVPVGFAKFLEDDKDIMAKLDIPEGYEQHITLALGYVDEWPEAPERSSDDTIWI